MAVKCVYLLISSAFRRRGGRGLGVLNKDGGRIIFSGTPAVNHSFFFLQFRNFSRFPQANTNVKNNLQNKFNVTQISMYKAPTKLASSVCGFASGMVRYGTIIVRGGGGGGRC